MQPASLQPTDETMRGVSRIGPEAMADVQGNGATEAPHDKECSPVEAVSFVETYTNQETPASEEAELPTNRNH